MLPLAQRTLYLLLACILLPLNTLAKTVEVQWKTIESATEYELMILKNGKTVLQKTLPSTQTAWSGELEQGLYTYKVRGIDFVKRPGQWTALKPLVVMPEGTPVVKKAGKEIQRELNDSTKIQKITVYKDKTTAPIEWKELKGASAYKVEIIKDGRVVHSQTTTSAEAELPTFGPGKYRYEIKPIIKSEDNQDPNLAGKQWVGQTSQIIEATVEEEKTEAPETAYTKDPVTGEITSHKKMDFTFSGAFVPYNYIAENEQVNRRAKTDANATQFRGEMNYWKTNHFAIHGAAEINLSTMSNRNMERLGSELFAQYAITNKYNVTFKIAAGPEMRQFIMLSPDFNKHGASAQHADRIEESKLTTGGIGAKVELEKRFLQKWEFAAKFQYFMPVFLWGAPRSGSISKDASYRNYIFGPRLSYTIYKSLAVGVGAHFDFRAISYVEDDGNNADTKQNRVFYDNTVIYGFIRFGLGGE